MTQQTIADCYRAEIADLRQQIEHQRRTNEQICDLSERLRAELAEKMEEIQRLTAGLESIKANMSYGPCIARAVLDGADIRNERVRDQVYVGHWSKDGDDD